MGNLAQASSHPGESCLSGKERRLFSLSSHGISIADSVVGVSVPRSPGFREQLSHTQVTHTAHEWIWSTHKVSREWDTRDNHMMEDKGQGRPGTLL